MSKHKIRYILPLLAVMASAAYVGAAGSSDKTNEKDVVFVQYNTYKKLCPSVILNRSLPSDHHRVRPDKPPILSGRL